VVPFSKGVECSVSFSPSCGDRVSGRRDHLAALKGPFLEGAFF
jgi:hypothetical protein